MATLKRRKAWTFMQQPKAESELFVLPSHMIDGAWQFVAPLLDLATNEEVTLQSLYDDLIVADAQLWCAYRERLEAALVTKIQTDAHSHYCLLLSCGGENPRHWAGHLPQVEEWARSHGCTEMRIYGRRGWAKLLGYDEVAVKMRKAL